MIVTKREAVKLEVVATITIVAATVCRRCGDDSKLDQYGLCTKCNTNVDEEYKMLYTDGTMEH